MNRQLCWTLSKEMIFLTMTIMIKLKYSLTTNENGTHILTTIANIEGIINVMKNKSISASLGLAKPYTN